MQTYRNRMHAIASFLLPLVLAIGISLFLVVGSTQASEVDRAKSSVVTAQRPIPPLETEPCTALRERDFLGIPDAPTSIMSTELVSATAKYPEYCNVIGSIAPQIQFELRLPTQTWNGRYLQGGCPAYCGNLAENYRASPEYLVAVAGNFAVGVNNGGHIGRGSGGRTPPIGDGFFGFCNELRNDYGYRSTHVMALAAKAIIAAFYGKSPTYSYFKGWSNGGRQGLMEAQRYPDDFNGIIAGASAIIHGIYDTWNALANLDAQGNQILTTDKLALIHYAALTDCDGKDGLIDGQIADPRVCTFDPESLQCTGNSDQPTCLTAAQVAVVQKFYQGPVDSNGHHLYPGGEPIGSELAWEKWIVGKPGMDTTSMRMANLFLKYLAFPDIPPEPYSYKDFEFTVEGFNRLRPLWETYNPTNPNLKAFRDRGGKLILYHGWADQLVPPSAILAYYQAVQDTIGGIEAVQQFARLFMFPGFSHSGANGSTNFDLLTPIVAWVEQGVAPSKIIASQLSDNGKVVRTRPVFPYPMQTQYIGKGSIDDASNFVGVMPSQLPDDRFSWVGNDLFQPK